jgi:uncharacterized protein YciI
VTRAFVVFESRGAAWDDTRDMDNQVEWRAHAAFMDALVSEGVVTLGGPLEGTRDVVLVMQAESCEQIRARLARDPWVERGLLTVKDCRPWRIRLGRLPE